MNNLDSDVVDIIALDPKVGDCLQFKLRSGKLVLVEDYINSKIKSFVGENNVEKTEWVLVETVSSFRIRYMVEVPKGKDVYALDTVTMEEAKEFSQEHMGELIVSHRAVTEEEALKLCDEDNTYTAQWDADLKKKNFFTSWEEQDGL